MRKLLALCVFVLGASVFLAARKSRAESNESEIRQLWEHWASAFQNHDINGVMAMYAPQVVAYDFVPPLQYSGRDAYRRDYEQFLAQIDGPIGVEFRDLKIVAGEDVGFVHALEHLSGKFKNGQAFDFWGRCTSGFQKLHGKWMDTHDHCSVPADFETDRAVLDLKP